MYTSTVGTGVTITLGSAVPGHLTFADSGVVDGDIVSYSILDGTSAEVGTGTYTASGTIFSRTTVLKSTNGGSRIALTGAAQIFVTALKEDFDHDALVNFVANEHIDHSTITITAGNGLTGGGDLTASRTINFVASNTTSISFTVSADGVTATVLPAGVDHNALANYVADQHVAHSGVTITAGAGLTGGGTIAANRTIDFVAVDTTSIDFTVGADSVSAVVLPAGVNHNALMNYVADQHIAHSGVTITAGNGLTGGGTIAASRTLDVGVSGLGLSVSADAVVLTSSSNPGAVASILASDASGYLQLVRLGIGVTPSYPLHVVGAARIDGDLTFVGAQSILTSADALTLAPATDLILIPTSGAVKLTTGVALKSDNYASQTTGWGISYTGYADFRTLYTDELHARSFITDLEQALAGGQIISKSVAVLASTFTVPAQAATASLVVEAFAGFDTAHVFQDGDLIRLRQFSRSAFALTITDCWGTVVWVSNDTTANTQTYTFTRSATPNEGGAVATSTIPAGTLALDYGTTGNGYLESNAIDGNMAENSPYHQVVTWTTHPVSGLAVRTRLGNLEGLFPAGTNEFGLFAGDGTADTNKFIRASNTNFEIHNASIQLYDGASKTVELNPTAISFAMGSTLPSGFATGDGIWMGKDTVYKFRVGSVTGERIAWDGTDLYIYADNSNYTRFTGTNQEVIAGTVKIIEVLSTPSVRIGVSTAENILISSTSVNFLNNGTSMALLDGVTFRLGDVTSNNVYIESGHVRLRSGTTTYTDLAAGVLTLGDVSNEHVTVDTAGVSLYDNTTLYGKFASTTTLGLTTGNHISITSGNVQLKNGATIYTNLAAGVLTLGDTSNEYVTVDTNGVSLYDGATMYARFAATTTIGQTGSAHVSITSAGVSIKNNTITRISMLGTGSMTINDTAGNPVITFDSATGATINKILSMSTSTAAISLGVTPPTSATVGTGLWIDYTGLYALDTSVQQVALDSAGLKWGKISGNFLSYLNDEGIIMTPRYFATGDPDNALGSLIQWKSNIASVERKHFSIYSGIITDYPERTNAYINAWGSDFSNLLISNENNYSGAQSNSYITFSNNPSGASLGHHVESVGLYNANILLEISGTAARIYLGLNSMSAIEIYSSTVGAANQVILKSPGSVSLPVLCFSDGATADTGIFQSVADTLNFAAGGVEMLRLTEDTNDQVLIGPAGAVGYPALSWINDPNTGLYNTADKIYFALGGVAHNIDGNTAVTLSIGDGVNVIPDASSVVGASRYACDITAYRILADASVTATVVIEKIAPASYPSGSWTTIATISLSAASTATASVTNTLADGDIIRARVTTVGGAKTLSVTLSLRKT